MAKNQSAGFEELLVQAKITNRLLAAQLRDRMSQKDLVKLLMSTDASDKEVAEILDTTAGTISVTKQRLRKASNSKGNRVTSEPGSANDAGN